MVTNFKAIRLGLLFAFLGFASFLNAQTISVTGGLSPAQIAATLMGGGIQVSNVTMNCPNGASGTFANGGATNLGIGSGVLLTSGSINNAPGPNNATGSGTDNFAGGDTQLNNLFSITTFDACALEFDFVPNCDTIQIAYVFGSEEYPEYVNGGFNDAFGFFISGPGFAAPTNIATIPGSALPVSIDNVNDGLSNTCVNPGPGCTNCAYYVNNCTGTGIQYDGFTVPLLAKASVIPCSTYHVKLVIADAGDGDLDSGVFLEENGIVCSSQIQVSSSTNSVLSQNAVEGCVSGIFTFARVGGDSTLPITLNYLVQGSAQPGVDYQALSGSITIPANQGSASAVINAFADGIPEGLESIMIILPDTLCSTIVYDTAQIFIADPPEAIAGPDTSFCSGGSVPLGAPPVPTFTYQWTPSTGLSSATASDPTLTLTPPGSYTYQIILNDTNGCTDTDFVDIEVFPLPTSGFTAPDSVCLNSPATITYTGTSQNNATYNWVFAGGTVISGTGSGPYQVSWNTPGSKTISLEVTDTTGCVSNVSSVNIQVIAAPTLSFATTPPTCPGLADGSVNMTITGSAPPFTISWTGPNGYTSNLEDPANLTEGTYSVTVTDALGCPVNGSAVVGPPPNALWPFIVATDVNCSGGADGALDLRLTGGATPYTYQWSNGPTSQDQSNLAAGTYSVAITDDNGCVVVDSATISEPAPLVLNVNPTDVSCNGDSNGIVTVAATGGHGNYSYLWSNASTLDSIGGLFPGTYTVTVTDSSLNTDDVLIYFEDFDGYAPWTLNIGTGVNDADSNFWVINDNEGGVAPPGCGIGLNGDNTLHITSQFCPTCGAAYDAGGGVVTNTTTQVRAESPVITSVGYSGLTLDFNFISNGQGTTDNASVWYNDGTGWTLLAASIKSGVCPNLQGQWQAASFPLPASCNNNPNLQIGFEWENNNDGIGTDPSIAINNVAISSPGTGPTVLCTAIDSGVVAEPGPLGLSFNDSDPSCFGGADGTLTALVSGGNNNFSYNWSNGDTTQTADSLTAGTWIVTVSDTAYTSATGGPSVVVYAEDFDPSPATWNLTASTGANDPQANQWQIDDDEGGVAPPGCGVASNGDNTLHITSVLFPTFGAAYDAGGGIITNTTTNRRAESPNISTVGQFGLTLSFDFIGNGQGTTDNASLWYNDGTGWTQLVASLKSTICAGGQGQWTAFNIGLPASCNNIPNLQIGFNWTNNNDGVGTDPSVAINNIEITAAAPATGGFVLCTVTDSFTLNQPPPIVLSGDSSLVTCANGSDGSAWVTASGGAPNYTYFWNTQPTQVTDTAFNLGVGTYQVLVTDNNGCEDSLDVGVTAIPPMVLTASTTPISCNGGADGTASVSVADGTAPFQYSWNTLPPQTTSTATNLNSGNYTVTVTDANNCQDQISIPVVEPSAISITMSMTPVSCFGGADGTATATVTGGTPPYNYLWVPSGQSGPTAGGLAAGTYKVIVSDLNNCQDSAFIAITEPTQLSVSGTTTPNQCWVPGNNGTATANPVGGAGGYTYVWNVLPQQFTKIATGLPPGPVTCTVTDLNGCQVNLSLVVGDIGPPTITAGPDVSFCEGEGGDTLGVSVTGGSSPYYYSWWCNQPICGLDSVNDDDPVANPTITSTYFIQVTDRNGCTSNIDSLVVTVLPKPLVNAGPDMYICPDSAPCNILQASVTGAPGPFTYQWYPSAGLNADTIQNPCARPDTTTIYTLVVGSINGCQSNQTTVDTNSSVLVHVYPLPMGNAGPDTSVCFKDSVELPGIGFGAGPAYQYQWAPSTGLSNPNIPNPLASPPQTTTYTLQVWSNGCSNYADTVEVLVHTLPTVSAGNTVDICLGETAILDGDAGGDSTATSYTYNWTPGTGVIGSQNVEDLMTSPTMATWYYLTATSNWGCESPVDSALVQVIPTPEAEAGPNLNLCEGQEVMLQGSISYTTSAAPPSQVYFNWTPTDSLSDPTILQPIANPTQSTMYYLTATHSVCSTTDSVLVTVFPDLNSTASSDTSISCEGDSVQFYSSGGLGNATFTWMPAAGLSDPNDPNPLAAPGQSTVYTLIVEEGGCFDTLQVNLDIIPRPEAAYTHSQALGCVPFEVNFLDLSTDAIMLTWNFGDGSPVSNEPNPTHSYTIPGIYPVSLTATNSGGCSMTVVETNISVADTAHADFDTDPSYPASLTLPNSLVGFLDRSIHGVNWAWDFGDGTTSDQQFPSHQYTAPGTYFVNLTVTNPIGCVSTVRHGPFVVLTPDLMIPNVFTPNDDGFTDLFRVDYSGDQPFTIQIYDRWGVMMYNSTNKTDGWDGITVDGLEAGEGVYFYVVKIGQREYNGNLTLIR